MKANEAPERLYLSKNIYSTYLYQVPDPDDETAVEYTRTDAFVEKVINFLNYKLDDVVLIRVPDTVIPHHVAKQELIEDIKQELKK